VVAFFVVEPELATDRGVVEIVVIGRVLDRDPVKAKV